MTAVQPRPNQSLIAALRRVVALEYAFVEACQEDAARSQPTGQAQLASRARVAQVHLFDLGTALRELDEDSLSYSSCVRQAMLHRGGYADVTRRLDAEYRTLIARTDLPVGLNLLLRANAFEHTALRATVDHPLKWAA